MEFLILLVVINIFSFLICYDNDNKVWDYCAKKLRR